MNTKYNFVLLLFLLVFSFVQTQGQSINCVNKVNLGVNASTDEACFTMGEIIKNSSAFPVDLKIDDTDQTLIDRFTVDGSPMTESNRLGLTENTEICIKACNLGSISLRISSGGSSCSTEVSFKSNGVPTLTSTLTTDTYLTIETIPLKKPTVSVPCNGRYEDLNYQDWVEWKQCDAGVQDTQRIIYREWEVYSKDGSRTSLIDTIYVFYMPKLTAENFVGKREEEEYCVNFPVFDAFPDTRPFNLLVSLSNGVCRTIKLKDIKSIVSDDFIASFESELSAQNCPGMLVRKVSIKQVCWSSEINNCTSNDNEIVAQADEENGYFELEQWISRVDTLVPRAKIITDTIELGTTHDCFVKYAAPPIKLQDNCSGVMSVFAEIPGFHKQEFTTDAKDHKFFRDWYIKDSVKLWTLSPGTYPIIYASTDSCGNFGYYDDTTYVTVVDNLPPLAIADKEVNLSLEGKEMWVSIDEFDEGSYDNCSLRYVMGRRTDWTTACGVNYCDKESNSVEDFYDDVMFWLEDDGKACSDFILDGYKAEIKKYQEDNCAGVDEHGNPISSTSINVGVGGGWASKIPFCCEDACKQITVEILAVDANCNYSKAWVTVNVEENQAPKVSNKFDDLSISCDKMEEYQYIVQDATAAVSSTNNPEAFKNLDAVFGGLLNGWTSTDGTASLVDENGKAVDTEWKYKTTECYYEMKKDSVAIEGHDGGIEWIVEIDTMIKVREVDASTTLGAISNLCSDLNVVQDIWDTRNECGLGTITRRWKVSAGCADHANDEITIEQKIIVSQNCGFDKNMFTLSDKNYVCGFLEYNADGNVNLDGMLDLMFTAGTGCRNLGISHTDKVFEIQGEQGMYKIHRTWEVSDWCSGESIEFDQKIIVDENCADNESFRFSNSEIENNFNERDRVSFGEIKNGYDAIPGFDQSLMSQVFPNPFADRAIIRVRNSDSELTLRIYDSFGKNILTKRLNSGDGATEFEISSKDLSSAGMYFYQIDNDKESVTGTLFFTN